MYMKCTWWCLLNNLVHERLCEHRFIDFIVTVTSVTDQIDNTVLMEGGAPFSSNVAHMHNALSIISVHVEDWSIYNASNIYHDKNIS